MDGDSKQVSFSDLRLEKDKESISEQSIKLPWEKPILHVLDIKYTDLECKSS